MKSALVFTFMTFVSSVSFGDQADLYVFNALKGLGTATVQEHGKEQIFVTDVQCAIGGHGPDVMCSLHDNFGDAMSGKKLEFNNDIHSETLANLLIDLDVADEFNDGMMVQTLKAIHCTQAMDFAANGSAAERTHCEVEHKLEPLVNCLEPVQDGFEQLLCQNVIDIYNIETIDCLEDYGKYEHTCENVKNPDTGETFSCLGDVDNNIQVNLCQSVPNPATVRIVNCTQGVDETSEHDVWMCTKVHKADQSYMRRRLNK